MTRRALALACIVDLTVGDPPASPHPVRLVGRMIEEGEKLLRSRIRRDDQRAEMLAGALLSISVVVATCAAAALAARIGGGITATVLGAAALAVRSLDDSVAKIERALNRRDIEEARRRLAEIVGRDTENLGESEIARATLEAAAESLCDGIVAPLLALRVGGVCGAWGYKAVSTLDSMIGHIEAPYTYFGRAAAKLDDIVNFIPSRACVLLLALAAAMLSEDANGVIRIAWRDGGLHRSPNAGWCEAALAGALHRRLGGDNTYAGKLVPGAILGAEFTAPCGTDILRARRLVTVAAVLGMLLTIGSARA
jgi:adenosylcobinamide-phosphate synthase